MLVVEVQEGSTAGGPITTDVSVLHEKTGRGVEVTAIDPVTGSAVGTPVVVGHMQALSVAGVTRGPVMAIPADQLGRITSGLDHSTPGGSGSMPHQPKPVPTQKKEFQQHIQKLIAADHVKQALVLTNDAPAVTKASAPASNERAATKAVGDLSNAADLSSTADRADTAETAGMADRTNRANPLDAMDDARRLLQGGTTPAATAPGLPAATQPLKQSTVPSGLDRLGKLGVNSDLATRLVAPVPNNASGLDVNREGLNRLSNPNVLNSPTVTNSPDLIKGRPLK